MRRIGIDVGGTNTDAVLLEDGRVVHAVKTPTTADVTGGIVDALALLRRHPRVAHGAIDGVVIGTTHFINAVVQRRDLAQIAAVRIGMPASAVAAAVLRLAGGSRRARRAARCSCSKAATITTAAPIMPFDEAGMRAGGAADPRARASARSRSPRSSRRSTRAHEERARGDPRRGVPGRRGHAARTNSAASACWSARTRRCSTPR